MLKGTVIGGPDKEFWEWVWRDITITPKLKVFIWRGVNSALPVMTVLSARIRHLSPLCPICKNHSETIMHALFLCEFAQRSWLISSTPLRTQGLSRNFKETISKMSADLSEADMVSFVCNIWAIWRMRNKAVYGGKSQSVGACQAIYRKERESCQVNLIAKGMLPNSVQIRRTHGIQVRDSIPGQQVRNAMCFVDGAWDPGGNVGIGVCLWQDGEVVCWVSKAV